MYVHIPKIFDCVCLLVPDCSTVHMHYILPCDFLVYA